MYSFIVGRKKHGFLVEVPSNLNQSMENFCATTERKKVVALWRSTIGI